MVFMVLFSISYYTLYVFPFLASQDITCFFLSHFVSGIFFFILCIIEPFFSSQFSSLQCILAYLIEPGPLYSSLHSNCFCRCFLNDILYSRLYYFYVIVTSIKVLLISLYLTQYICLEYFKDFRIT